MIQKWYNPFIISLYIVFLMVTLRGTFITLTANSWWIGWLGMEINLLGFIILILNKNRNESALKYFVVQSLGSVILISRALTTENFSLKSLQLLLSLAIFLKLGIAPLHYWIILMVESFNKFQIIILLTWQKLAPLYLLFSLPPNKVIYGFIIMSLVIGAFCSLNELRIYILITYSSINHAGWLLLTALSNELIRLLYVIIYTIIITTVITPLSNKQTQSLWLLNNQVKYIVFMNLLSLAGLPPFSGFIIKWILLSEIYFLTNIIINMVLILTRIVLLYFYLRLRLNTFLRNKLNLQRFKPLRYSNLILVRILNVPLICLIIIFVSSI